jgi:putative acetyltransferase
LTEEAVPAAPVLQLVLREEAPDDIGAIDAITRAAFRSHPFSRQTEHLIVRALREAGALHLSLVATLEGQVVGHVAFSRVRIDAQDAPWCGLGPLSVAPAHQRAGIGSALVRSGLRRLGERGVAGCVVLGDPAFYTRLGFAPHAGLVYPGPPAQHFMALALAGTVPTGVVAYHAAFSAAAC